MSQEENRSNRQILVHQRQRIAVFIKQQEPRWAIWATILGLPLAIIAIVLSIRANQTTTQAHSRIMPITTPVMQICTNAGDGYQLKCLNTWSHSITPDAQGMIIASPDEQDWVYIESTSTPTPVTSYHDYVARFLVGIGDVQPVIGDTTTPASSGQNMWTSLMGTCIQKGVQYQVQAYGLDHNGKTYFVVTLAPSTEFAGANAVFQLMLQSFLFTR